MENGKHIGIIDRVNQTIQRTRVRHTPDSKWATADIRTWDPELPENIRRAKAKGKAIYNALLANPQEAVTYGRTAGMSVEEQTELVDIAKNAAEVIEPDPIVNLDITNITLQNYLPETEEESFQEPSHDVELQPGQPATLPIPAGD
jgi:hypothetical protein